MSLTQKVNTVWNSNGCYIDTTDRMLRGYATSSSTMTTEKCLGTCLERGFKYAATQNGVQCFCGNEVVGSGSLGSPTSVGECSTKCPGTLLVSGAVGPSVF
jgi:glucan endo-1,3-alpha-glucosidase